MCVFMLHALELLSRRLHTPQTMEDGKDEAQRRPDFLGTRSPVSSRSDEDLHGLLGVHALRAGAQEGQRPERQQAWLCHSQPHSEPQLPHFYTLVTTAALLLGCFNDQRGLSQ